MPKKNFCVIVPAFNEEKVIEDSLNSLKKVLLPDRIFVVSDGSTDKTVRLAKKTGVNVMGLRKNTGKAGAILKLLKSRKLTSRFKYILFSDADGRLSPDFKKQIRETMKIKPALLVATVKSDRHGLISAFRTYEYGLSHLIYKNAQNAARVIAIAPGCASLYRSDVLEKLNFKNGTLSEDFDLTLQIHQQKLGRIIYVPKASVYTQDPITLKDFWKQVLRWNTGFWQNFFLHRLFLPTKKINLEIILLAGDAFFAIGVLAYFLHSPFYFFKLFAASIAVMFAFVTAILVILRQFWAILYAPFFPFLYMINLVAYVSGFVRAIIGQKRTLAWGKVARYQASPQK